jgi:hypothetical protein
MDAFVTFSAHMISDLSEKRPVRQKPVRKITSVDGDGTVALRVRPKGGMLSVFSCRRLDAGQAEHTQHAKLAAAQVVQEQDDRMMAP